MPVLAGGQFDPPGFARFRAVIRHGAGRAEHGGDGSRPVRAELLGGKEEFPQVVALDERRGENPVSLFRLSIVAISVSDPSSSRNSPGTISRAAVPFQKSRSSIVPGSARVWASLHSGAPGAQSQRIRPAAGCFFP